jgi:hypothetical protein
MERLDGMDASFVYLDTPATPMQVGMTCVFDPSTALLPWTLAEGIHDAVHELGKEHALRRA